MIRSTVRSTLVTLSSLASAAPIEAITATFIIVTLTYFQLLHAIKGSEFFQVPQASIAPKPRPVHLVRLSNPPSNSDSALGSHYGATPSPSSPFLASLTRSEKWAPLPVSDFRRILEANALEGGYTFPPELGGNVEGEKASVVMVKQMTVSREDGESGVEEWAKWVLNDVGVDLGGKKYTFQDLCFECHETAVAPHPLHPSQSILTLYLNPPTPDTPTLTYLHHLTRLPPFVSSTNTTFRIMPTSTGGASGSWGFLPSFDGAGLFAGLGDPTAGQTEREEEELLSGMRNVRWFAYAARAFVMRFYALAKVSFEEVKISTRTEADCQNADSADIFVVLLGYVLMHGTFVHLFINMRALGSSFWLRKSPSSHTSENSQAPLEIT